MIKYNVAVMVTPEGRALCRTLLEAGFSVSAYDSHCSRMSGSLSMEDLQDDESAKIAKVVHIKKRPAFFGGDFIFWCIYNGHEDLLDKIIETPTGKRTLKTEILENAGFLPKGTESLKYSVEIT